MISAPSGPRVFITGGTGFVGAHLIPLLRPLASHIAVLSSGRRPALESDVEYFEVDIRKADAVRTIMKDLHPDHVYHLAGISTVDESRENLRRTYEVNVTGALNLFEAAMQLPTPPRILNVSSSQVYAASDRPLRENDPIGPENPYAASKAMAELLVVQYRERSVGGVITARPFNHTGPGQPPNFVLPSIAKQFAEIEAGLRPPTLTLGNIDIERDFTDVRDVVRAYWMLLTKGRFDEVYNVCSGSLVSLRDIIELFQQSAGIEVSTTSVAKNLRLKDVPRVCGDPEKLCQETGWHPEIPLKKTVEDLLSYWRRAIM
ncbi:MAG: GDP-mannose 4,6-dehydratase [Terriglobales bacterium]|jgi:GDP-4-dehydro-6-deoxy-D-mannose reductase